MTPDQNPVALPDGITVPAVWLVPPAPRAAVALAHGAGAGMDHPFICAVHETLAASGFACVKFQFPYMANGRRAPDRPEVLEQTWRAVLAALRARLPGLPLVAAGKSMGGRIASRVATSGAALDGLVLLGYPLHPAGRPQRLRTDHFPSIRVPSLFVQGTRDALCDLALLRPALRMLGEPATLHVVEGADHSFRVLKRGARAQGDVDAELLGVCRDWIEALAARTDPAR